MRFLTTFARHAAKGNCSASFFGCSGKESTAPGRLSELLSPKLAVNPSLGAHRRHPCLRWFGREKSRTARAADTFIFLPSLLEICLEQC
jgi:hypothetical protein